MTKRKYSPYLALLVAAISAISGCDVSTENSTQPINANPVITSLANYTIPENSTGITTIIANDTDGDPLTLNISGGADKSAFIISTGGTLSFTTEPDYESPQDSNTDNQYDVEITVTDGTNGISKLISVIVTNINEPPTILTGSSLGSPESFSLVTTVLANDPDGDMLNYYLSGGNDIAHFDITNDGTLRFKNTPEYESPQDYNADNIYEVEVTASDGTFDTLKTFNITVTDILDIQANAALITDISDFIYTRPGVQHVQDYDGVWLELKSDEFGIQGGRRVKNYFLNSGKPDDYQMFSDGEPTATYEAKDGFDENGFPTRVFSQAYTAAHTGKSGPYLQEAQGNPWAGVEPGTLRPGTIYSIRFDIRQVYGTQAWNIYHRNLGYNSPPESGNWSYAPGAGWNSYSSTFEQKALYVGFGARFRPVTGGQAEAHFKNISFEDLTGKKSNQWSNEYVESGNTPGIQWFTTRAATLRENPSTPYGKSEYTYGGKITDAVGENLTAIDGVVSEPAATNLYTGWNTLEQIGWLTTDGAANYPLAAIRTAPGASGGNTAFTTIDSMTFVKFKTDIEIIAHSTNDKIKSTTTDFVAAGFLVGQSVHGWRANTPSENGELLPAMEIQSVTAHEIVFTTGNTLIARAAGNKTSLFVRPAIGDNIMFELNDGTWHYTTITDITPPPYASTFDQHDAITLTIADSFPSDWGYASTDNKRGAFFWNENTPLGVTKNVNPNSLSHTLVNIKDELIQAGLGYLSRTGLAIKLSATGTYGSYLLDALTAGKTPHTLTTWARATTDESSIGFQDHIAKTSIAMTMDRLTHTDTPLDSGYKPEIIIGIDSDVYILLQQLENSPFKTSPIITRNASATRNPTLLTKTWGSDKTNNITGSLLFTPSNDALTHKQVLWSVHEDIDNYLELEITNTTVKLNKVVSGIATTAQKSLIPVAGTTYTIEWEMSAANGMQVTVDSAHGDPVTTANAKADTGITAVSLHQLGSINNTSHAIGAIKHLIVK